LKLSHSKLTFYNEVDWCKLPCPAGRKLDTQLCVTIIEKWITITSYCALFWISSLCLTKHFEVTWV